MFTSADAVLSDGRAVRLRAVPYEDPVARELVARVQQEYTVRYGGPDEAVVDPGEFLPPVGLFLVAEVDGVPADCGAWRRHQRGVVEVKRMYVKPAFRRLGLARLIMTELEESAAEAGHRAEALNSGDRHPGALALSPTAGSRPFPGSGFTPTRRARCFSARSS